MPKRYVATKLTDVANKQKDANERMKQRTGREKEKAGLRRAEEAGVTDSRTTRTKRRPVRKTVNPHWHGQAHGGTSLSIIACPAGLLNGHRRGSKMEILVGNSDRKETANLRNGFNWVCVMCEI